jgi:tetratricopeptide (TPR) repeat protein
MHATHPALARAQLLMDRRRFRLAEEELRRALGDEPENGVMHGYLALCLAEEPARALEAMDTAIRATVHDPDTPFTWYALSRVAARRGTWEHAEKAGSIALSLAAEMPELLVHMAELMMRRDRLRQGLEFAERALAAAPDDPRVLMTAGTLRSRLGQHARAKADFARALERAPENNAVQGNAGWSALRRRDADAAIGHFRASLRLDPGERGPRVGLLEAMRARNPLYRVFLPVALRFYWLQPNIRWVAVALSVALLAYATLVEPVWLRLMLQALIAAAAVCTWAARPLADLVLLRDPAGRMLLDRTARAVAILVGVLLLAASVLGLAWAIGAPRGIGMAAILAVLFTIPVMGIGDPAAGWPRAACCVYVALMAIPATFTVLHQARRTDDAGTWLGITVGGLAFSHLLTEFLPRRR